MENMNLKEKIDMRKLSNELNVISPIKQNANDKNEFTSGKIIA